MSANSQSTTAPEWKHHVRSAMGEDTNAELKLRSVLTAAVALANLGDSETPAMHDSSVSHTTHLNDSNDKKTGTECGDQFFESRSPVKFPEILMEILSDKSNSDSITWLGHGRSFIICNRKKFSEEVLPRYWCKTPKYTSFTRKLGRWDFVRVSNGREEGAFYHKLFRRDEPDLCKQMTCRTEKVKTSFASSNTPAPEPVRQQRLNNILMKTLPFTKNTLPFTKNTLPFTKNTTSTYQKQIHSLSCAMPTHPVTSHRLEFLRGSFPINPLHAPEPIKPGFSPETEKMVVDAAVRALARSNALDGTVRSRMTSSSKNPALNMANSSRYIPLSKSSFALRKGLSKNLVPERKVRFSLAEVQAPPLRFPSRSCAASPRAHAA